MSDDIDKRHPYIPPIACVACGRELKGSMQDSPTDYNTVSSGVVGRLYAPYGSENDGTIFQIGICDECIKSRTAVNASTGKIEPAVKAIGDYMDPGMDAEIKHRVKMSEFKRTGTYTVGGEENKHD